MATWFCGQCTTEYSVGAPCCPHCQATDPVREEEQLRRENEMAKITVHGGPSNADTGEGMPEPVEAAAVTDEVEVATATVAEATAGAEPVTEPELANPAESRRPAAKRTTRG